MSSNLYASAEYKNRIINLLLNNENFVKLMNPDLSDSNTENGELDEIDILVGGEWQIDGKRVKKQGQVFDFNFVSETISESKTFLFVETVVDSIQDKIFTDFEMYICVFTDKDLVRLTQYTNPTTLEVRDMGFYSSRTRGNRIDALCDCIDGILNENPKIKGIGDLEPSPRNHMTVYQPNNEFYGKCLRYHIKNYNPGGEHCGDN